MNTELKHKRFLWGLALALVPCVPMVVGLSSAFRGISREKATGLAAVAGGLAEAFVLFGIGALFISQMAALVLLSRAFSEGHWMRNAVSVMSICLSGLTLSVVGLFVWFSWISH